MQDGANRHAAWFNNSTDTFPLWSTAMCGRWRINSTGSFLSIKCMHKQLFMIKLELYRAHTPRAAVSMWESSSSMPCQHMRLLTTCTYILCQVVRMSRKHMVGSVDRRGQQTEVFVTLMGLAKRFEAQWSQFFDDINEYAVLTSRSDT